MSAPVGSTRVVWGKFYDSLDDGAPIDPINLRLVVEHENALTVYTAEIVRIKLGVFYCLVTLTSPGAWHYRWESDDGLSTPDYLIFAEKSKIADLELVP